MHSEVWEALLREHWVVSWNAVMMPGKLTSVPLYTLAAWWGLSMSWWAFLMSWWREESPSGSSTFSQLRTGEESRERDLRSAQWCGDRLCIQGGPEQSEPSFLMLWFLEMEFGEEMWSMSKKTHPSLPAHQDCFGAQCIPSFNGLRKHLCLDSEFRFSFFGFQLLLVLPGISMCSFFRIKCLQTWVLMVWFATWSCNYPMTLGNQELMESALIKKCGL